MGICGWQVCLILIVVEFRTHDSNTCLFEQLAYPAAYKDSGVGFGAHIRIILSDWPFWNFSQICVYNSKISVEILVLYSSSGQ